MSMWTAQALFGPVVDLLSHLPALPRVPEQLASSSLERTPSPTGQAHLSQVCAPAHPCPPHLSPAQSAACSPSVASPRPPGPGEGLPLWVAPEHRWTTRVEQSSPEWGLWLPGHQGVCSAQQRGHTHKHSPVTRPSNAENAVSLLENPPASTVLWNEVGRRQARGSGARTCVSPSTARGVGCSQVPALTVITGAASVGRAENMACTSTYRRFWTVQTDGEGRKTEEGCQGTRGSGRSRRGPGKPLVVATLPWGCMCLRAHGA